MSTTFLRSQRLLFGGRAALELNFRDIEVEVFLARCFGLLNLEQFSGVSLVRVGLIESVFENLMSNQPELFAGLQVDNLANVHRFRVFGAIIFWLPNALRERSCVRFDWRQELEVNRCSVTGDDEERDSEAFDDFKL